MSKQNLNKNSSVADPDETKKPKFTNFDDDTSDSSYSTSGFSDHYQKESSESSESASESSEDLNETIRWDLEKFAWKHSKYDKLFRVKERGPIKPNSKESNANGPSKSKAWRKKMDFSKEIEALINGQLCSNNEIIPTGIGATTLNFLKNAFRKQGHMDKYEWVEPLSQRQSYSKAYQFCPTGDDYFIKKLVPFVPEGKEKCDVTSTPNDKEKSTSKLNDVPANKNFNVEKKEVSQQNLTDESQITQVSEKTCEKFNDEKNQNFHELKSEEKSENSNQEKTESKDIILTLPQSYLDKVYQIMQNDIFPNDLLDLLNNPDPEKFNKYKLAYYKSFKRKPDSYKYFLEPKKNHALDPSKKPLYTYQDYDSINSPDEDFEEKEPIRVEDLVHLCSKASYSHDANNCCDSNDILMSTALDNSDEKAQLTLINQQLEKIKSSYFNICDDNNPNYLPSKCSEANEFQQLPVDLAQISNCEISNSEIVKTSSLESNKPINTGISNKSDENSNHQENNLKNSESVLIEPIIPCNPLHNDLSLQHDNKNDVNDDDKNRENIPSTGKKNDDNASSITHATFRKNSDDTRDDPAVSINPVCQQESEAEKNETVSNVTTTENSSHNFFKCLFGEDIDSSEEHDFKKPLFCMNADDKREGSMFDEFPEIKQTPDNTEPPIIKEPTKKMTYNLDKLTNKELEFIFEPTFPYLPRLSKRGFDSSDELNLIDLHAGEKIKKKNPEQESKDSLSDIAYKNSTSSLQQIISIDITNNVSNTDYSHLCLSQNACNDFTLDDFKDIAPYLAYPEYIPSDVENDLDSLMFDSNFSKPTSLIDSDYYTSNPTPEKADSDIKYNITSSLKTMQHSSAEIHNNYFQLQSNSINDFNHQHTDDGVTLPNLPTLRTIINKSQNSQLPLKRFSVDPDKNNQQLKT